MAPTCSVARACIFLSHNRAIISSISREVYRRSVKVIGDLKFSQLLRLSCEVLNGFIPFSFTLENIPFFYSLVAALQVIQCQKHPSETLNPHWQVLEVLEGLGKGRFQWKAGALERRKGKRRNIRPFRSSNPQ